MEILFNIEIIVDDDDIVTSRITKSGELADMDSLTTADKFTILAGLKSKKNGVIESIKNSPNNHREPLLDFFIDTLKKEM